MNTLIIGSGGREHGFAWKCSESRLAEGDTVYVAPGNAGTALEPGCKNVDLPVNDPQALAQFALDKEIGLTIVGPEQPLTNGIVKTFQMNKLPIFGPSHEAAQLEGSKVYSKKFMGRHGIPTAPWSVLKIDEHTEKALNEKTYPIIIKADHLCAGKGVLVAHSANEAMQFTRKLHDGSQCGSCAQHFLVEDMVTGTEMSFMCVVDTNGFILPLASSQDHKARDNGGKGPNTGGMGAFSPSPLMTPELHERIMEEVIRPTVAGAMKDGYPFTGFLYAGLMIGDDGEITVLEYNVRMGDPETQPIFMRLKSDLVELCIAAVNGTLDTYEVEWDPRTALGVVLAAKGYPDSYEKGFPIAGLDNMPPGIKVFHAGTGIDSNDSVISTGGRVLCVTTLAPDLAKARGDAYGAIEDIYSDDNLFCRTDIGDQ